MIKIIPVVILFATILVGCGEGGDRQAKYLERAEKYFAEENYDKAKVDARNVLQINPKNVAARLVLGDISYVDGDIRKAYGMYQSVVDEGVDNVNAHAGLAKVYTAVKAFDKAVEYADKVLAVEPSNSEIMGFKAVSLIGQEQLEEAEALATEALVIDPGNTPSLGVMMQLLVNREDYQPAIALLEQGQLANADDDRISMMKIAVLEQMGNGGGVEKELVSLAKKHPDSSSYSNALARYYIRESEFDNAEKEIRVFAKNNEDSIDAKRRLISYLQQHKTQEAAIQQAEAYIESEPDRSEFYITLAQLYLFTGDKEQGRSMLDKAIDVDPRSVGAIEARNIIAQLYMTDKDFDSAKTMLAEVLEIEPENELALLRRAGISLADNELKDGISDLRVVLKNNPENTLALSGLAGAQEANGNDQLALDNYKKLISIKAPDIKTLASAARLSIKSKQYSEAEKYIRLALEKEGEDEGLITNLIRLLVLKEDWESASVFANRLIESEDSKALGYYLQAGLDLRLEKKPEAIKNLKQSLAHKPEALESLTSIARVLNEEEGLEAAISYVDQHCEKYPGQPHCHYILGSLHAQGKNFDTAEAELKAAIGINDKLVAGYRQLAKVYAAKGIRDKAEQAIKQGVDKTGNSGLMFDLASFYYGSKQYELARDMYSEIIEKNEEALAAKNNLAMIYVENLNTPENTKKARALIADLQESENPAFLDTVGWVLYLSGDYDQAVSYLEAAVDKVGSSGLLQYHLGMAYYKTDDLDAAKKHLALAVENENNKYPGFEEAMSTLQNIQ